MSRTPFRASALSSARRIPAPHLPRRACAAAALTLLAGSVAAQSTTSGAVQLPTVQVTGEQDGRTEGSGSYAQRADQRGAAGLALSARETPQSVSTVTRQRMDDQALTTVDEVLTSTTGITYTQMDNAGRTAYRARGFAISNYKVDGLDVAGTSDLVSAGASFNMDLYDSVEIVRGANGLMGGTGDPSASVNYLRKRPGKTFAAEARLSLSSWSGKRLMADLNSPLNADGSVRARLTLSGNDANAFRDHESNRALGALASVEADFSHDTRARFGLQYERSKTTGASWGSNVPIWYADGTPTRLSRSTNVVADWSFAERETRTVFGALEHSLGGGWRTDLTYAHTAGEVVNNYGVAKANNATRNSYAGFWNQDGTGAYLNALHSETDSQRDSLAWNLRGAFELGGRTHELAFGLNGYRNRATSYGFSQALGNCTIGGVTPYAGCQYRATGLPIGNWQTWDGSYAAFETFRTAARTETVVANYGGYAAGRFDLADALKLIAGLRVSNYKTYADSYTVADVGTRGAVSGNTQVVTPYLGLVYDIGRDYSVYAGYTEVFSPQTAKDASGNYLDPITGNSYEVGVKGELFDKRLNASFAVFRVQQRNIAVADGTNATPDGAQAYVANGDGARAEGFEVDLSGQITPSWNAYLGYTYLSVHDDSTTTRADPRHLLRLATSYRFSGALRDLTLGGNVSLQSATTADPIIGRPLGNGSYDTSAVTSPGYMLLGLMARYRIDEKTEATLNVSNLLDRTYYRNYGFYSGLIYGEPRRITVGLNAKF